MRLVSRILPNDKIQGRNSKYEIEVTSKVYLGFFHA